MGRPSAVAVLVVACFSFSAAGAQVFTDEECRLFCGDGGLTPVQPPVAPVGPPVAPVGPPAAPVGPLSTGGVQPKTLDPKCRDGYQSREIIEVLPYMADGPAIGPRRERNALMYSSRSWKADTKEECCQLCVEGHARFRASLHTSLGASGYPCRGIVYYADPNHTKFRECIPLNDADKYGDVGTSYLSKII